MTHPPTTTRRILIATGNPGKLRDIRAVFADVPVGWCTLADLPAMPPAIEDCDTFEGNAEKKALHYAAHSALWTLADDSGLVVDALDGAPGVHSARYSSSGRDADNNRKLVEALVGIPREQRTARFVCCLALARPGSVLVRSRGTIEGVVIDEPRGANGFGYDPHFYVPALNRTTAELDSAHKNRISHRGTALRALLEPLSELLHDPA